MKQRQRLLVALAVLFCVAGGFALYASWPLLNGTDIVLATRPVDPFDLLRGQYMAISYNISNLPAPQEVQNGDTIYVSVQENQGIWHYVTASKGTPSSGVFLRGTVDSVYGDTVRVRYGIEQFFFEQGAVVPTQNITVHAKVDGNGHASIVNLLQNGKPITITYKPVSSIS